MGILEVNAFLSPGSEEALKTMPIFSRKKRQEVSVSTFQATPLPFLL